MSDINWREFPEDESLFEKENRKRAILILTNIGVIRQSIGDYIDWRGRCRACGENVIKYAFID